MDYPNYSTKWKICVGYYNAICVSVDRREYSVGCGHRRTARSLGDRRGLSSLLILFLRGILQEEDGA